MTVRELIAHLANMDQDLPVAFNHFEDGPILIATDDVEVRSQDDARTFPVTSSEYVLFTCK